MKSQFPRIVTACVALACAGLASAADAPAHDATNGLRIVTTRLLADEGHAVAQATVARSRLNRLLTPVTLEFRVYDAAERELGTLTEVVSAADMPRRNSARGHVRVTLPESMAAATHVRASWRD
jgi:hypothetical protein